MNILLTPIEYLKGVGPQRAELLKKELNIFYYKDLLYHFPFRYADKSVITPIRQIKESSKAYQIKAKIIALDTLGEGRKKRLVATVKDESGIAEVVWFKGLKWVLSSIEVNKEYLIYGKPVFFNGKISFTHPEMEKSDSAELTQQLKLSPIYSTTEKLTAKGLSGKNIQKLTQNLIPLVLPHIEEFIPEFIRQKYKLLERKEAFKQIHFPENETMMKKASFRLKFEELFLLQTELLAIKSIRKKTVKGFVFEKVGRLFNTYYHQHLPFPLTNAQKRVIKEIRKDLGSGIQMNRLLQGDVGSGKTIVALLTILMALDNNYQAALIAPTEILANQHYTFFKEALKPLNIHVGLLTGSTKSADRKIIDTGLKSNELKIVIGTHALLEDKVQFHNLGLVIIDEQHRFGVAQRAKMWKKNTLPPHILVMTATPIPRTLAMTVYGDLDVSIIDEMPPGRKPVKTVHKYDSARNAVFGFMKKEIEKGRQIYVVYPLIEESEKLDYKDLMDGYESIKRAFPPPEYQISIVHGQMKPEDKDYEMLRFAKGETQIMVATTVIEVGVNVPNASVMVIESAERFGLSQLHQLRGRVGRGADQSYCILMTGSNLSKEAQSRIGIMVQTNNGFKIAEADLKLRGPGDITGVQQSGMVHLKIADLSHDQKILQIARTAASEMLQNDPNLQQPEHQKIKLILQKRLKNKLLWSRIS